MAMADEHVYKISSRYLQKWLRYDIKHIKAGTFHVISGLYRDIDAPKSVLTLARIRCFATFGRTGGGGCDQIKLVRS